MGKNTLYSICSLAIGISLGIVSLSYISSSLSFPNTSPLQLKKQNQVIGFLPYWLLTKANTDYSKDITTLTYFSLRIDADGSILKLTTPTQEEPGWYALQSGNVNPFLTSARTHHLVLSLALDSGDNTTINSFISHPTASAQKLVSQVKPLMHQYGFSDLNLDIEYTQHASPTARTHFVQFIQGVRKNLPPSTTLTLEISTLDVIEHQLIDVKAISPYADNIILMAYDYHTPDSFVTGPVAPLGGAGTISEYDVATAVQKSLQLIPTQKLILGIPLYGYEWETLGTIPRSPVIPGSGFTASNRRAEDLLSSCPTCHIQRDTQAIEPYISYFSPDTNTNHIIFFPDQTSTQAKVDFAQKEGLGGLALWALGYEGNIILKPLTTYIR